MSGATRMPPYWIGWYDRWNLVLPLGFVALLVWVLTLPRPVSLPRAAEALAPTRQPAPVPLQPTTMDSPANGSRWDMGQAMDVVGRAHPGTVVVLAYSTAPSLDRRELARVTVGADGRYGFRISRFPRGQHVLQATAMAADGRVSAAAPVDVWVTEERGGAADQRRRRAGPKK